MAIGLVRLLHERGLRVPDDVSVVGFDDSPLASHTVPALTSVAIPMYEIGRRAMALLRRLLEDGGAEPVVLPVELRIRETTAPPRPCCRPRDRAAGAPGGPRVPGPA